MDHEAYRSTLTERGRQIAAQHSARVLTEFLTMLDTPEGAAQVNATGDDLEAIKDGMRQALREKEREELRAVYETLERAVKDDDPAELVEAHELFTRTSVRNLTAIVSHLEALAAGGPADKVAVLQTRATFALAKNDLAALGQASRLYAGLDEAGRRRVFDVWATLVSE